MIGKKLQWDDFQERRENFWRGRQLDDVVGSFAGEMILFSGDGDDDAVAGFHFFDIGDAFFVARDGFRVGVVAGCQNDYWKIFVDKSIGAVFHLAGGVAFRVNVGNFLELEGAFESDGIVDAAAEVEKIGVAEKLTGEVFVEAGLFGLENGFHFVGDASELLHKFDGGGGSQFSADLAKIRSKQQQSGELRGERFCGGHADFRAGVRDDRASGFAGDHRAHYVADGERRGAFDFRFTLRGKRVRCFAGLADANGQCFGIEDGIAIAEFAAVIDFDLQAREALDHEFSGEGGVPACSAGDDAHLLELAELLFGDLHFVEEDLSGVLRDAAEQSIAHGAGLLENFFLHEMLVAALFGHDGVPSDVVGGAIDGAAVVVHDADTILREDGDIPIGEEENLARVFEKGGDVAGDKKFTVAEADHGRRADARGDDLVWIAGGKKD